MVLVCHVILQNHVIKDSSDFIAKNPFRKVTILPTFVATDTVVVLEIMVLVCHVISEDHVIKCSCNFMGAYPSW